MTKNHPDVSYHTLQGKNKPGVLPEFSCPIKAHPLSQSCCRGRVRICKVKGNRKNCARMAHLGVIPGAELELLCPHRGRQCMIKVNGGTISLDTNTAKDILVTKA